MTFYFPIAVAVTGMLFYHLAQKSIAKGVNPFLATIIAYVTGIVVCAICAFAFPGNKSLVTAVKQSNWAVYVMGAAAACIEIGFLLAYRNGWILIVVIAIASSLARLFWLLLMHARRAHRVGNFSEHLSNLRLSIRLHL